MPVANGVHEREQDVKAGPERAGEPAEPLDDVRALLRYDDRRLRDRDQHEKRQHHQDNQSSSHVSGLLRTDEQRQPSVRMTVQRRPLGIPSAVLLRAVQVVPRSSTLADGAGGDVFKCECGITHQRIDIRGATLELQLLSSRCRKTSNEATEMTENSSSCTHAGPARSDDPQAEMMMAATPKKMM